MKDEIILLAATGLGLILLASKRSAGTDPKPLSAPAPIIPQFSCKQGADGKTAYYNGHDWLIVPINQCYKVFP